MYCIHLELHKLFKNDGQVKRLLIRRYLNEKDRSYNQAL